MAKGKATGGETRPTGETTVRRYTAEEHAERERRMLEMLGEANLGEPSLTLRVVHSAEGTRVSLTGQHPHPVGDGMAGETVELELDAEHVRALVAACERVLAAHGGRAKGAAMRGWMRTALWHAEAGEV